MSQAAFNPRRHPSVPVQHRGTQLAGLLFLLLVLCAIIAGCWMVLHWMHDPQRLPISQLVITGERHYTRNDDIRQAILESGSPGTFMTQDVNVIQQQIERLPWIKQVSVRKHWPNELKIHVIEYVAAARWDRHSLIDNDGNAFNVPPERMGSQLEKLMQLSGPEGSELLVLQESREMAQVLAQAYFTLQAAAMTARHSWQLTLSDGILLNLGRDDRMQRLQRFIVLNPVLQQQEQRTGRQISYVDLRYDSGAAVGWVAAAAAHHPQQDKTQAEQR